MGLLFWACLFLIFLLYGKLEATDPFLDPANPMLATERGRVLHFSAHDPCSRWGYWFAIDEEKRTRAINDCELAYDGFTVLTDTEQASCLNAWAPFCRSGFGCNRLEYKCTFLCETEVEVWRRQGAGRLERVLSTVRQPKDLRTIAATVVEPRSIWQGSQPQVYTHRGHRRCNAPPPYMQRH